jgi:hypothetical protein
VRAVSQEVSRKTAGTNLKRGYSGVVKDAKEAGISNIRVLFKIAEIAHWYTHKHHVLRPVAAAWGQMNGERELLDADGTVLVSREIYKLEAAVGMVWVAGWYRHRDDPEEHEKFLASLREVHANLSPGQNAEHRARCRAWRDSHQEHVQEYNAAYYQDHKEEKQEYGDQYNQDHKEEIKEKYRKL